MYFIMQFLLLRTQLEHFLAAPEIPFNEISRSPEEEVKRLATTDTQDSALKGIPADLLFKPIE